MKLENDVFQQEEIVRLYSFCGTHFVVYHRRTFDDYTLKWYADSRCWLPWDYYLAQNIRKKYCIYPFIATAKNGYSDLREKEVNDDAFFEEAAGDIEKCFIDK